MVSVNFFSTSSGDLSVVKSSILIFGVEISGKRSMLSLSRDIIPSKIIPEKSIIIETGYLIENLCILILRYSP